jgi:WD40 repeat protein
MRILTTVAVMLVAEQLIAAPLKDKPATPISAANVQKVQEVATLQRDAFQLEWLPGSDALAVAAWEDEIEVFDGRKLTPNRKLAVGRRLVKFAISRDGEQLAWAENTPAVTVENLKAKTSVTINAGSNQPSLAFSPDGKLLVTGGYGRSASVWEIATAKKVRELETDTDGGLTPVFSPDGKTLALGNRNSDPRLFETATGKLLHVFPKRMTQEIRFNPAGTVLATTYVDGSIGLWDVATGKALHEAKTTGQELYSVDWNPKGDLLVTAGLNAKIIIWDAKELKPLRELDAPEWVIRARFSPDGSRVFTAGGSMVKTPDRKITVWGLPSEK